MSTQYATAAELEQLGIASGALTGMTTAIKNAALLAASDVIDGYLRARFTLPLSAWGSDIKRACCIIAVYDLLTHHGFNPSVPTGENIRLRFEDIIRWLEGIAANRVTPDVTDGSTSGGTTGGAPRVASSSQRGWSRIGGCGGPFSGD